MRNALLCTGLLAIAACRGAPVLPIESADLLAFEGNREISVDELIEASADHLREIGGDGPQKTAADDAAYRMEAEYRRRGYAQARVDYTLEDDGRVRFAIDEGPLILLESLEVTGGEPLGADRVRALTESLVGEPGSSPFVRRALDDAVSALAGEARRMGFLDARIRVEGVELDHGRAHARVEIDAGLPHTLTAVELEGDVTPAVSAITNPRLGAPYRGRLLAELQSEIEETLRDAGHPDAAVDVVGAEAADGRVTLRLRIQAGPKVVIRSVRFEGKLGLRPGRLEDLVRVEPGDVYSVSAVRESFGRLYRSGLFQSVSSRLEPATGAERDLVWQLEEIASLELWIEPGWGSYDGPRVRAGLREQNVFDTGWAFRSGATLSDKTQRAAVGFTEPLLFGSDLALDLGLDFTRREEPSFEYSEVAFESGLSRVWTERLSTTLTYRFARSDLLADDLTVAELAGVPDDFDISSLKLSAVRDARDHFLVPTTGHRAEASLEWADAFLGSELNFVRVGASLSWFRPLRPSTVLGFHAGTGLIAPSEDQDEIPLQERFFLGGESTVRSFGESELGPHDAGGEPIGGEGFTLFSAELRQRLPWNLEVATFADTGRLVADHADLLGSDGYRHAFGAGLRYVLPIGALRVDVGWNPNASEDEDDYALHFSIGQAF